MFKKKKKKKSYTMKEIFLYSHRLLSHIFELIIKYII